MPLLRRSPISAVLLAALATSTAAPIAAQGSSADYERAAALRERFDGLAYRTDVDPEWLDARRLWYAVTTGPDAGEVVVVDAAAPEGARRRVLATTTELRARLGVAEPEVARLSWELGADAVDVLLAHDGGAWRLPLDGGEATPLAPEAVEEWRLDPLARPGRSWRARGRSAILFVNRTEAPVELFWVDLEREQDAYGTVAPGARRWIDTYRGHAWVVQDAEGERLAGFVAGDEPGVALVDGEPPTDTAPRRGPAFRARQERGEDDGAHDDDEPARLAAFLRDGDVWLRDRATDREHRLTTDGTDEAPYEGRLLWSPDRRFLLCRQVEQGEEHLVHLVEAAPDDRLQPVLHSFDYTKPGDRIDHPRLRLFAVEVDDAGELETRAIPVDDALFPTPWRLSELEWEADSSRFTFLYDQRGHQVVRWLAVDAESGAVTTLVEEAPETFVDYSQKRTFRRLERTDELLWASERSGWNQLYLLDARDGRVVRPLPGGAWVLRAVDDVDEEARTVRLRVMGLHPDQDPYHEHYVRVGLDDGAVTVLTEADGTHRLEFSPGGDFYVDRWSRVDHPPVTELRRTSDGALVTVLEEGDWTALRAAGWRPPQRFVAKGRDGETDIWGIVHRPTNFDPAARYPVVESIYAGPHDAHVPKSFRVHRKEAELAELGFVVVQIDGMGTNWRTKAFHDVCWQDLGDAGFPDRIPWIRALAAEEPALDLERVGIYGGSAGGQNALRALIAHHDFYSVAVADCGCHDNRMDKIWWNEAWMGWPVGPHYEAASNVAQAHRMEGKLFLVVGELDRNVDPASTMQVVDALIEADKDFDLLVVPGGGHGIAESPYGTRRRRDFLVRHLLGVEPRWE